MKKKLLRGRFSHETSTLMEKFSSSIDIDQRLAPYDIQGSMAHVKMLNHVGLIQKSHMLKIIKGLNTLLSEIKKNKVEWDPSLEDIHMNIESKLIEMIGDDAKIIHTARSRNDQVMVDIFLYLKDHLSKIKSLIEKLQQTFLNLSQDHIQTILPGYTHLQHGQPVLLAHHMLAYIEMFDRDKERINDAQKRLRLCPLGATALAGTSLPIDRDFVAKELGFEGPSRNSMDTVASRDMIIETLNVIALIGSHLSRLGEELIIWSSKEFNYVQLSDSFTTGSSAMPQKRNPDAAELIRGKSARLIGNAVTVLTLLKGLSLTYMRDLQEDKPPLFDSVEQIEMMLEVAQQMLKSAKFNQEVMALNIQNDGSIALDLAEYLVEKGLAFRSAYQLIGEIVKSCEKKNQAIEDLTFNELKTIHSLFDESVMVRLKTNQSPDFKKSFGSTNPKLVMKQIQFWKKRLSFNND